MKIWTKSTRNKDEQFPIFSLAICLWGKGSPINAKDKLKNPRFNFKLIPLPHLLPN